MDKEELGGWHPGDKAGKSKLLGVVDVGYRDPGSCCWPIDEFPPDILNVTI